ncbi:MAG TPA: sulfurtransferase TusA family protein [Candidatus Dormibacteraeota bacterium]|nr:sulfurtransferase TusA family protein [Candidatus Dormibacteraeota bacterium]
MEIDHCVFPDDLLYDVENNTWLRKNRDETVTAGVTSLLPAIAGRLVRATLKTVGTSVAKGQSLGTLESEKFVGPVPSPVSGRIIQINQNILDSPRTINAAPYGNGWIAILNPENLGTEARLLQKASESQMVLAQKIAQLHVRCFKAFPDRDLYEIGTECAAVIVRLNETLATMPVGEVVHLVSDDPTAYVEMMAWSDRTGQNIVDWRREGELFHFIIRKVQ